MIQSNGLTNAIAAINAATVNADYSTEVIAAKCRALAVGYDRRFRDAGYTPIAVEAMRTARIINPDTGRPSRTFMAAGKLDVLTERNQRRVLFDHKTTSQDITDPAGFYWRQLAVEGQVSHYMLLEWLNGDKVDDAVWDVMRKPQISPKKLSATDRRAAVASREYCGVKLSMETLDALQRDDRETLEMYEARLVRDCTVERPEHYFQRRTVPRLDSEILDYARELWRHGQDILNDRAEQWHARNSGACLLYGTPCKFLGICSGYDQTDSLNWNRKVNVHNELPELKGDGRDVLTNSRIRCFQTCRRKHFYEYELGIERVREEEREALLFGSLWHLALEAWWKSLLPQEANHGYCTCEPAGNELASYGAGEAAIAR